MSDGDTTNGLGGNSAAELKRRVDRRIALLDEVAEIQEDLKQCKAEDKADGFTEKAIADAVRLRRADAEKVLAQLLLEAEIDVYRRAAGVAADIETAQAAAREHVNAMPEPKPKTKSGRRDRAKARSQEPLY